MEIIDNQSLHSCAQAHPNIAFIKYWGNTDNILRIPQNGSISMNLGTLWTKTYVEFNPKNVKDELYINNVKANDIYLSRVSKFLDVVRKIAGEKLYAKIRSVNNFPIGAGIASSASAFAALALAASNALQLDLSEKDLSILARKGSGSASRSIPSGFVEWLAGDSDKNSYSFSLFPPEHWGLVDCIAVIQSAHKQTSSTHGHSFADTSPLQFARVVDAIKRLEDCKTALFEKDFDKLAYISELDSNLLHAVMLTSTPTLMYWEPGSVKLMKDVMELRKKGTPVFYTLDAGPNVHVITTSAYQDKIKRWLNEGNYASKILVSNPGDSAKIIENDF